VTACLNFDVDRSVTHTGTAGRRAADTDGVWASRRRHRQGV